MTSFLDPEDEIEVKLHDIRQHPEHHRHDFIHLCNCCTVHGMRQPILMDAHERAIGKSNAGRPCDVTQGPCACGAWHF